MDCNSLEKQVQEANGISDYQNAINNMRRYFAKVQPTTTDAGGETPIELVETAEAVLQDCDSAEEFHLEGRLYRALGLVRNDEKIN